MKFKDPIYVTRPDLPDLSEFMNELLDIWSSRWLTNNGPKLLAFEKELKNYLDVPHLSVYSNGTIALLAALKSLDIQGEVITTPFSFVATSHAIVWNNLKPVFADIDPKTGNLDPDSVKEKINDKTAAIMPVHVYGTPCDLDAFENIRNEYKLKLIYDAAHCFGVKKLTGEEILTAGDLSVLSFHATKAFNSVEGGAIVSSDEKLIQKLNLLKNFGFKDEVTIDGIGINGKMNELLAAFGLLQLKTIDAHLESRKDIFQMYSKCIATKEGVELVKHDPSYTQNYSYVPIRISEDYDLNRDELYEKLKAHNVFSRRYFYPLISNLDAYKDLDSAHPSSLPIANTFADSVICLPIYGTLSLDDVKKICSLI